jgi:thiamine-monophosphate kinase
VESDFVGQLIRQLPRDRRLEVPPGDDAAVLRPTPNSRPVITVDLLTEGVDFLLQGHEGTAGFPPAATPAQVGKKAVAVSLSDLAAMAAVPEAVVVAVALPRHGGRVIADELTAGVMAMTDAYGVTLAGGDTNSWDGPLVISVTALGSVAAGHAWRRDRAQTGDLIVVTGPVGGSLLGRHLNVEPRCREAVAIARQFTVHAAIDISDGLALDLSRLTAASDVGGVIDLKAVPVHPDAERLAALQPASGKTPLEHALGDGEDFELLLAMPAAEAIRLVATPPSELVAGSSMRPAIIGEIVAEPGLQGKATDGSKHPLAAKGFDHAFE